MGTRTARINTLRGFCREFGIEHAPGSTAGLYRGENLGERIIRIAPEDA